jgi:hypothetical protein
MGAKIVNLTWFFKRKLLEVAGFSSKFLQVRLKPRPSDLPGRQAAIACVAEKW